MLLVYSAVYLWSAYSFQSVNEGFHDFNRVCPPQGFAGSKHRHGFSHRLLPKNDLLFFLFESWAQVKNILKKNTFKETFLFLFFYLLSLLSASWSLSTQTHTPNAIRGHQTVSSHCHARTVDCVSEVLNIFVPFEVSVSVMQLFTSMNVATDSHFARLSFRFASVSFALL